MRPSTRCGWSAEDLALEGDPQRNLATFVTTWMEPEAQRIIAENLHRNFIDHAEYPISAEIEQRCVRMLADLFHAPGETTGCRTQGSSEAIMLGALSLKWKWKERREAANLPDRPAEPGLRRRRARGVGEVLPLLRRRAADRAARGGQVHDRPRRRGAAPRREHHRGRRRPRHHVHRAHGRHRRDQPAAARPEGGDGLDIPLHVDGASGGFVWPFLYPDSKWDFRLEQVRSINVSGHKYGLVYPGIGWLVFREKSDLAEDLVFYENYLGKTDATFTLNFSTGASMVLAQYYNFVRLGRDGYTYVMKQMQQNARALATNLRDSGRFEVIGDDLEQLPLVAFRLKRRRTRRTTSPTSPGSSRPSAAGWCRRTRCRRTRENVKIMRALVKETMSREQVDRLTQDIEDACATLDQKGGTHPDRARAGQAGDRLLSSRSGRPH